jgi:hypothetical protein
MSRGLVAASRRPPPGWSGGPQGLPNAVPNLPLASPKRLPTFLGGHVFWSSGERSPTSPLASPKRFPTFLGGHAFGRSGGRQTGARGPLFWGLKVSGFEGVLGFLVTVRPYVTPHVGPSAIDADNVVPIGSHAYLSPPQGGGLILCGGRPPENGCRRPFREVPILGKRTTGDRETQREVRGLIHGGEDELEQEA